MENKLKVVHHPTSNCNKCYFWKRLGSNFKGVKIPNGYGKCIHSAGHCNPEHPRAKS